MQNIATSNLSIININNKTSTNPLVRFSGFPSTKSRFLCQKRRFFHGFGPVRAQNWHFCALLPSKALIFRLPEHKIWVFVRFYPQEPPFSGISSTKSRFLCAICLQNPHFRASRAQNQGFCAFLAFGTPVFRHFEHKIEVCVRFLPSEPQFSSFPSTKSPFLCSSRRGIGIGKRKMVFLQITFHASKI